MDKSQTQAVKVGSLRDAGIDASHVRFVPVDFSRLDVFSTVREHGAAGSVVVLDVCGERMRRLMSKPRSRKTLDFTKASIGFCLPSVLTPAGASGRS